MITSKLIQGCMGGYCMGATPYGTHNRLSQKAVELNALAVQAAKLCCCYSFITQYANYLIIILQTLSLLYRSASPTDLCTVNAAVVQSMTGISALCRSSPAPVLRPSPGSPNTTLNGLWAALDSATGAILWQTPSPLAGAMAVSMQGRLKKMIIHPNI